MTKLSCGPVWKENKWENVVLCIFFPQLAPVVKPRGLGGGGALPVWGV